MNIRYTIAWKIGTGFAVLIVLTSLVFYATNKTLAESKRISDDINEIYNPSVFQLEVLKLEMLKTHTYMTEWVRRQSSENAENKVSYMDLIEIEIPKTKSEIRSLYIKWIDQEKYMAEKVFAKLDTMIGIHGEIRSNLNTWDDYDDPEAQFLSDFALEDAQAQMEQITLILQELIVRQKNNAIHVSNDMVTSFRTLQKTIVVGAFALLIIGIIINFLTARSIVKPVNYAKSILFRSEQGNY